MRTASGRAFLFRRDLGVLTGGLLQNTVTPASPSRAGSRAQPLRHALQATRSQTIPRVYIDADFTAEVATRKDGLSSASFADEANARRRVAASSARDTPRADDSSIR